MKEIKLVGGGVALVDDEDYPLLSRHRWFLHRDYARTAMSRRTEASFVTMHRMVLGSAKNGYEVDHIDGNKLNNQKMNLRWATRSQNTINFWRSSKHGRGVAICLSGRFQAYIQHSGCLRVSLGTFATAQEARDAYDEAALKYHGPFALLNRNHWKEKG